MTVEVLKGETTFEIGFFNENVIDSGLMAVARKLQFLLVTEPNTYPSAPDLGIGIKTYIYEFRDEAEAELKLKISEQVRKFLPEVPLIDIGFEFKQVNDLNHLFIGFEISEQSEILIVSVKQTKTSIVSEIFIN